jgi:cyclic pyranopterin phosphate synthase
MPEQGVYKRRHEEILSVEEIDTIVRAAADCGINKVRLTGGEPLVRKGIIDICRNAGATEGIKELCLTTNGILLPNYAKKLRSAGVSRVNISLDTLNAEKYKQITRLGSLEEALKGLKTALDEFTKVKINTVLIGGFNDTEIPDFVELTRIYPVEVRFIELMPIGRCAAWDEACFISGEAILSSVPELEPAGESGVAKLYALPGAKGRVGLIRPISSHFCPDCNRLRLTSDGKLKPCLHSAQELDLRGLAEAELKEAFLNAIECKPQRHHLSAVTPSEALRNMNEIGG